MNGIFLIDKEKDWTSRDVCNKIQSLFNLPKVGHIGTLDPFATGLLIVLVNKATKAMQFMEDDIKEYEAVLSLGVKTSTGDLTGEIVERKDIIAPSIDEIQKVFSSFIGEMDQLPPMTSAIHVNGRKLYSYARNHEEINRPTRRIRVYELELLSFKDNYITFRTVVSKGTYIRTLGEDIAASLNNVGHLISLRRTRINDIKVETAKTLNVIKIDDLIPTEIMLSHLFHVVGDEILVQKAKAGVILKFHKYNENDIILIVDGLNNPIAIYQKIQDDDYKCIRGLW